MSTPPTATDAFTCDLSVDEFLLIGYAGWEPLALVSGDCTFSLGQQPTSRARSKELSRISDAHTSGQTRALERMRSQAAAAGGEGVVGVRLDMTDVDAGESAMATLQHFSAIGTAVRRRGRRLAPKSIPFTSHLSGQDTWALMTAGVSPLGLVFGFSAYHSRTQYRRLRDVSEMTEITEAVYNAREQAMGRMQSQANQLHAQGIVGVTVDMRLAGPHTITFAALGTAIARHDSAASTTAIRMAVDLTDRSIAPPQASPTERNQNR